MIDRLDDLQQASALRNPMQAASTSSRSSGFGRMMSPIMSSFSSRGSPDPDRRRRTSSGQQASSPKKSPLLGLSFRNSAGDSAISAGLAPQDALQRFLARLEEVRQGPLRALEVELQKVKALQANVLNATAPSLEKEALSRLEFCSERASAAAQQACNLLQELAAEVDDCLDRTEVRIRKLQMTRVSALFQDTLGTYQQVQQSFRSEMEKKVSRQLRVAFPEADDHAIQAVKAGQRSAASAIQDTMRLQTGAGNNLSIALAMQASQDKCDELERLVKVTKELRQRFVDVEAAVMRQGEAINSISDYVEGSLQATETVRNELVEVHASSRRARSWFCILVIVLACIVVIVLLAELHKI